MPVLLRNRWVQLSSGILSLIAVANFQYAWTLFVLPLQARHGWSRVDIQNGYILFLLTQAFLVPLEAHFAERFGPRRLLIAGSLLVALAWTVNARAETLAVLYMGQILSGSGAGIAYGINMGNALKWFPDRRGLAAGLCAAAFGAGSALTVIPIERMIKRSGYEAAFQWFGLGQGMVILLCALVVRFPRSDELPLPASSKVLQTGRDYTPGEVLRSPAFWLLYVMMTVGAVPGLFMIEQMKPMAVDFEVADVKVTLVGITLPAFTFAYILDRITGGLTRPAFGWISDHIGRECAMFIAFALEGTALAALILYPRNPVVFVLMSGIAFFGWGAIFSLFPATIGDLYGRKFATTNYGWLYTAKGMATLLVLAANYLQPRIGWVAVFSIMIVLDWLAALLAWFALRPMRQRWADKALAEAAV